MRQPQTTRILPVRRCVACRTRRSKNELIRVALTPAGALVAEGPRARAPGRGAYVCNTPDCVQKAVESGALDRALRCKELERSKLWTELRRHVDVIEEND